jgi:hypothetical protein
MDDCYWIDDRFTLVAGGQAGADRAALDWAIEQGVRHDGWCPRGRRTEDGVLPDFYRLRETPASGYLQRTEWNVRDSDATLVFTLSDKLDGGSKRTADFAERYGKPWLHVRPGVHPKFVARFLDQRHVTVLNVAGKRESRAPGIANLVHHVLAQALRVRREGTGAVEVCNG